MKTQKQRKILRATGGVICILGIVWLAVYTDLKLALILMIILTGNNLEQSNKNQSH